MSCGTLDWTRFALQLEGSGFARFQAELTRVNARRFTAQLPAAGWRAEMAAESEVSNAEVEFVESLRREIAPLVLTGPPSVTGFAGGRPQAEAIVAYWPALIDRTAVEPGVRVEILEA